MNSIIDYSIEQLDDVHHTDSEIILYVSGKVRIKISDTGFYVEGRRVSDDVEIYEAFKKFLRETGN